MGFLALLWVILGADFAIAKSAFLYLYAKKWEVTVRLLLTAGRSAAVRAAYGA